MDEDQTTRERRTRVEELLKSCSSGLIACSAGVDSGLPAAVAARVLGDKPAGFSFVSFGLEGFRSGSMNEVIPLKSQI